MGHLVHLQAISIFRCQWGQQKLRQSSVISHALLDWACWHLQLSSDSEWLGNLEPNSTFTFNTLIIYKRASGTYLRAQAGSVWLMHVAYSQNVFKNFHNQYQKVWISVYSEVSLLQKFSVASCHAQVCISFMNEGLLCVKIKILCLSAMKGKKISLRVQFM